MSCLSNIHAIHPRVPDATLIEKASGCIREGDVVIFPAFCLYGMAVDALNPQAIQKIFTAKGRPETQPLLILVPDMASALAQVEEVSQEARWLMEAFWPGRLTLVLKAKGHLPAGVISGTGKIGIRVPGHPVAAALVRAAGGPITGTSANCSGEPGAARITEISEDLRKNAAMLLNAGALQGGVGSTVMDLTCKPPRILREGAVSSGEIEDFFLGKTAKGLTKTMLFST